MGQLDLLRCEINIILREQKDIALQTEGWVHLYGVSQTAALLACGRGLNADLCAAAGLLHDIHTFRTGQEQDHALYGAAEACDLLRATGAYTDGEIVLVSTMILRHSDKQAADGPYEECLKDADVFAHWLYDMGKKFDAARMARLEKVMAALKISGTVLNK